MESKKSSKAIAVFSILTIALALVQCGWAATETVLYNFQGNNDGNRPFGVIMVDGELYGTAAQGGAYNEGTVFELVLTKSGWAENTLHSFTGQVDGHNPTAGLAADKFGHLFGAANAGLSDGDLPVIFEMTREGKKGKWQFHVLHELSMSEGVSPNGLILDDAGNLYGTAATGGGSGCAHNLGCGTVFELSPAGHGEWKLTTLHRFDGTDGAAPLAPLYRDARGNLYGTTELGGRGCAPNGCGTVFELSPSGGGWKFAVLHRFAGGSDGCTPLGPLAMDGEGALYGATVSCSTVYQLARRSGRWQEKTLYQYGGPPDARLPVGLVLGSDGAIYGPAEIGGSSDVGAIFELKRSGGGRWKESVPFSFDGSDGDYPLSLTSGGDGKYYGATLGGATGGARAAAVWCLSLSRSRLWESSSADKSRAPGAKARTVR